jgi:hypothetical protein
MKPDDPNSDSFDARLTPQDFFFKRKDDLRKSVADLSDSQVEYLSVAFLEKDLSAGQLAELEENLRQNSSNLSLFNSIQKIKLIPPSDGFRHKKSLKKFTAGQKVFRIAIAGLSAAAAIAILILSYLFVPGLVSDRNNQVSSIIQESPTITFLIAQNNPIMGRPEPLLSAQKGANRTSAIINKPEMVSEPEKVPEAGTTNSHSFFIASTPVISGLDLIAPQLSLIASNTEFIPVVTYDDRGPVRKFIAGVFREKILGEDKYSDGPIKPYEIAKAGVDGINRLLDWEMVLKENVDEKGELKSVYFGSTLLSFNAPVKKTDE